MIKPFDYLKSLSEIEGEVNRAIQRALHSGKLILGPETEAFEEEFAGFVGARHCVAVSSGTAALQLALMALGIGPGDRVITVSNTCAPTVAAIRLTGAVPVFVDVRESDLMMDPEGLEPLVGARTRCILPVHLWGQSAPLDGICAVARRHGIAVVEDCAQATGTKYRGRHVGTFGQLGCFSFYPTKNLGAYGDAGAIVTQDAELAARLKMIRMYGYDDRAISQIDGTNARIAEIQAAILRVKLRVLPAWLARRKTIADIYDQEIENPSIGLPTHDEDCEPSYHQYVIRCRDRQSVIEALNHSEIGFGIHYPTPVHLMPAFVSEDRSFDLPRTVRACDAVLSLPVHEAVRTDEARTVARTLNRIGES